MATIEITPEQMIAKAKEIKGKMEEWDGCVNQIYTSYAELDAMFEGEANKAFTTRFNEDRQKFYKLSRLMEEYQNAIIDIANTYISTDNEAMAAARK